MKLIKAKRTHLKEENRKFGPVLVEIPVGDLVERSIMACPTRVWRSRHFLVHYWPVAHCAGRLSVNRCEIDSTGGWKDGISWDELQELKSQAGFHDKWAVECYPPRHQVVNVANMRHLWLLDEAPAFGWVNTEDALQLTEKA